MKKAVMWKRLIGAALGITLLGCAEKLTFNRFETIHEGDPPEAVEATLGKPDMRQDTTWIYSDLDRQIRADVYFRESKVIGKTWRDPEHGMVGKSPYVNQVGDSHEIRYRETK